MSCNVCCETYTKRDHLKITCPRSECSFEACRTCIKTYIEQQLSNPHCMSCKFEYEDEFIIPVITRTYYNKEYKQKIITVMHELEKSLIPSTLEDAKRVVQIKSEQEEIKKLHGKMEELRVQISIKNELIYQLRNGTSDGKQTKKFIMKCQQTDCVGYLSTGYKCELCDKHTCPRCIEPIITKDEHVCDESAVETATMIKNETKPCPKCSQRILKIEGCDQMWCTECNTPFSWKSGHIINGVIHNPHYFEWLQKQGDTPRTHGDIPCGGIPEFIHLRGNTRITKESKQGLGFMLQFATHLYEYEMPRPIDPDNNKQLRIKYILKQINEETWKKQLALKIKQQKKAQHHRQLMEMLFQVILDILRRGNEIIDTKTGYNDMIKNMRDEYNEIIKYINNLKKKRAMILKQGDYMVHMNEYGYTQIIYDGYDYIMNQQNHGSDLIV